MLRAAAFVLCLALLAPQMGCAPAAVGGGAAVGVTAAQERGLSGALKDTQIRTEINHLWFQASEALYRKVSLQVQKRRVLLTGVVPDQEMRRRAAELAWQADDVAEVINEIEVDESYGAARFGQDTWISSQLKTKLLLDTKIKSINYSIETAASTIYLIGVARSRAELDRVLDHARNIGGVAEVVSYVEVLPPEDGDDGDPDNGGAGDGTQAT
jgi:osmotically-inducible protein OsmY